MNARIIVNLLLEDVPESLPEATVRLPPRGSRWVAVFTGVEPGKQVWQSTRLTSRKAALAQARKWEARARRQRAALGLGPRKPNLRVRRSLVGASGPPGVGPLSQREVATILRMSERAVRAIERRALEKLRRHPLLGELWAELVHEGRPAKPNLTRPQEQELTPAELAALFGLVRTDEEQHALAKLLAWIGGRVA